MLKKCELCSIEQAAPNGLLCTACREAIVRLLVIRESGRIGCGEGDPLEEIVMYPVTELKEAAKFAEGEGQGSAREQKNRRRFRS
jgi:hypothetical protein